MQLLKIYRRDKRRALLGYLTALIATLGFMVAVQSQTAPVQADSPYQGCLDENSDPLIDVYDAHFNNVDNTNGITNPANPWYVAKYFTYQTAMIDLQLFENSDPDDWMVYVVSNPNGVSGDTYASTGSPLAAQYTAGGGSNPLSLVGSVASPNTAVYGGVLNVHWYGSADEAQAMWFPRSRAKTSVALAVASTPKRLPVGLGIVRKEDWPGTYNYLDVISLPKEGPTSGSPGTPVGDGVIGVNDPFRCAFYYGEKLWNNNYTSVDEPGDGTDDECTTVGTPGVSQPRHHVLQHIVMDSSNPAEPVSAGLTVNAELHYTWCDMGGDDYPTPGALGEDYVRLESLAICYDWATGPPQGLFGVGAWQGIDLAPSFSNLDAALTLDVDPIVMDVIDLDEPDNYSDCSGPVSLRDSQAGDGDGDNGTWWAVNTAPLWKIHATNRFSQQEDIEFDFNTPCGACEYPYVQEGAFVVPDEASAIIGPAY